METLICSICEEGRPTVRCSDCQEFICKLCAQVHDSDCEVKKSLARRGHYVAGKEVKRGRLGELSDEVFLALIF